MTDEELESLKVEAAQAKATLKFYNGLRRCIPACALIVIGLVILAMFTGSKAEPGSYVLATVTGIALGTFGCGMWFKVYGDVEISDTSTTGKPRKYLPAIYAQERTYVLAQYKYDQALAKSLAGWMKEQPDS